MNSNLLIGSVVYGAAGIGCKVLAVEGDILTIETLNGTRTISSSKVVKVATPDSDLVKVSVTPVRTPIDDRFESLHRQFRLGDRVQYIGSDFNLKTQYAGTLAVWEISKQDINTYTCLKPNGRVTSWIESTDLQLVGCLN
jgi:hypothetical protein